MTDSKALSPGEGAEAIFSLMLDVAEANELGDLDRLEDTIDRMQKIVEQTGVEIPDLPEKISALKGQSRRAKNHIANTDAALWVGDFKRAERLSLEGTEIDLMPSSLRIDEGAEADDDDDLPTDDSFDSDFDLADFAAGLGIDVDISTIEQDSPPDVFADIAAGVHGAIDAAIDSGTDLNKPSGPSRHTALLAALDAPGRRVEGIRRLIEAGADAKFIHVEGDNTVSWAMGYDHPDTVTADTEAEIIFCLTREGASVNHWTGGELNALHRAILQAGAPQVAALLAAGADQTIDMSPDFAPEKLASTTCIMLAAAKPDVLRLLLDFGADATRADISGRDPIDFVRAEAEAARNRVDIDDEWTVDHAEALEISLGILERHLGSSP